MRTYLRYVVWIIALIPLVYLTFVWPSLSEPVPLHFGLNGEPDRFGSKKDLMIHILILTVVNVGVYLLISNAYRFDPKRFASENKARLRQISTAVVIFLSCISIFIIHTAKHASFKPEPRLIIGSLGLLWCILGNYMHTIRPNYFAGFRMPWTLNDDENWRKTHALGGKLWFAGGLLIMIGCLFPNNMVALVVFAIVTATIVIIPIVYSYRLYKAAK